MTIGNKTLSLLAALPLLLCAADYEDYPSEDLKVEEEVCPPPNLLDLDQMIQGLIIETKRIDLPGYPGAFNPSILRWRGSLLMSFRAQDPNTGLYPFGLIRLDENFDPIGTPQFFMLPYHNLVFPSKQQDPRLICVRGHLFLIYNNQREDIIHREMRRMCVVALDFDGEKFIAGTPEYLIDYEGKNEQRSEKNWVPFEYDGELLLTYSLVPHRILRPYLKGTGACETIASTRGKILWDWGTLRGGTQAVLDGDHYLSFFHSWIDIPTAQSNGRTISHYVMGAYTFEAHPPFSITAMSPEPIVADSFYSPPYYKTWKPLRCIFPAGIVLDENYVWISYGRQDHEIWIAKLDKKKLMGSLIPVKNIP